jgi:hypothetical protein
VVIDLDRRPSYGREVAVALRQGKATRGIAIVFAGGAEEKVAPIRAELPDAIYGPWGAIEERIARALASPLADPIVPPSQMERYAGRPLAKKLGWKESSVLALAGAPPGLMETLGSPPEGARVIEDAAGACDLLLWFARSRAELEAGIAALAARSDLGRLWIAWPKKASGVPTDLSQNVVREIGLRAGLVDFKVCSIDSVWSSLAFVRRVR